jgi:hypothetical protein
LFIHGTKEWDIEVLEKYMWPRDVDEVRRIRVPAHMDDDFSSWNFDSRGMFTVKSAYHVEPPVSGVRE